MSIVDAAPPDSSGPNADSVLLRDDFEGGISSLWTPLIRGVQAPFGSLAVTSLQAYSGSSSLQLNWLANNTSTLELDTPLPNVEELYVHFAVKWSKEFQFTPGTTAGKKIWRYWAGPRDDFVMLARRTGEGLRFSIYLNQMFVQGSPPNLGENIGVPTPVETDRWYSFDWHIVGGLGTGKLEGWVDGIKKWDYPNIHVTELPMRRFALGGNISPDRSPNSQTEWFDDLIVSTAPIR